MRDIEFSRLGRAFLSRISPVLEYHASIPDPDARQQRQWAFLDTHDALTDWVQALLR